MTEDIEMFKMLKSQLNEIKLKYNEYFDFMFIAFNENTKRPFMIYVPKLKLLSDSTNKATLFINFNNPFNKQGIITTLFDIRDIIEFIPNKDEEFFKLVNTKYKITNPLYKDIVKEMSEFENEYKECNELDEIHALIEEYNFAGKAIELSFKDKFVPKEQKKKDNHQLIMDGNIFVTSDLHLSHANMMDWEQGRWNLCNITQHKAIVEEIKSDNLSLEEFNKLTDSQWDNYRKRANEKYVKKYDEEIIRRWNEVVKEKDTVYVLGDFSFASGKETNKYLKKMNGKKILIKGNHENVWMDKDADLSLWYMILDYAEIKYQKYHFCMMHFPIQTWNKQHHGSIHLYGHVHSNTTTSHPMRYEIENSYNVGVDVNNYYPININYFIKEQM